MTQGAARRPIIVFDVNETLLDIEALTPFFARVFEDGRAMRDWFAQAILYSEAITLAGAYAPFGELGGAVLRMLGAAKGVEVTEADLRELKSITEALPAHPDVPGALTRLREAGFRLATLTNSAPAAQDSQLNKAGLTEFFERRLSIDAVGRYKPAPETYRRAARELGVGADALLLVAAHGWDTLGAQLAGCAAALVTRKGNAALPLAVLPPPDIVGPDLGVVAQRIIERG